MKTTAFVLTALGTLLLGGGATLSAQGRGNNNGRIPPGQQPRPGQCRVWYDNVPPGRQPAATDCRTAESIAARDRSARVIYGSGTNRSSGPYGAYDPYYGNNGNNRNGGSGRAYPRGGGYYDVAFSNGFTDGAEKGREDVSKQRTYDPSRHGRFRDGNHLYQREYGSEERYKGEYRQGFIDGYDSAFQGNAARWNR